MKFRNVDLVLNFYPKSIIFGTIMVVVAQLVRAPDCGSGGRRFETDLPPQNKRAYHLISLFWFIKFFSIFNNYSKNIFLD